MAKTQLTRDIEEALHFYGLEQDEIVVAEVSMPDGRGIVDTLTRRTKPDGAHEWRCYEIKVSKSDFKSRAKVSFIGHYNYYVMPKPLYDAMKDDIPKYIGAVAYLPFTGEREGAPKGSLSIVKKATRRELAVDEMKLMASLQNSLFREVLKARDAKKGLQLNQTDELFGELARRYAGSSAFHPDTDLYRAFAEGFEQEALNELRDALDAATAEYNELRETMRQARRITEPYL